MIKLEEKKIRELLRIGKKVAKLLESGCYIEYFEGVEKDVLFDTPYKIKIGAEPLKEVAKYILSLLETREKEAVEGFYNHAIGVVKYLPDGRRFVNLDRLQQYLEKQK